LGVDRSLVVTEEGFDSTTNSISSHYHAMSCRAGARRRRKRQQRQHRMSGQRPLPPFYATFCSKWTYPKQQPCDTLPETCLLAAFHAAARKTRCSTLQIFTPQCTTGRGCYLSVYNDLSRRLSSLYYPGSPASLRYLDRVSCPQRGARAVLQEHVLA
jgi:hypothetical protein